MSCPIRRSRAADGRRCQAVLPAQDSHVQVGDGFDLQGANAGLVRGGRPGGRHDGVSDAGQHQGQDGGPVRDLDNDFGFDTVGQRVVHQRAHQRPREVIRTPATAPDA
jgi:hypothetical protein